MTKIYDFPTCPVAKQLFHVPGAAMEGGYTAGAVRILSPEPGGRSVLEMQIAFQVREWEYPIVSWLSSKGNGEVFRIRLAPTPQILSARNAPVLWEGGLLWSTSQPWAGDIAATFAANALEGENIIVVSMAGHGDIARPGHVIGDDNSTYKIDEVVYNAADDTATMVVKPPLRRNIVAGSIAYFRPWFLGTIGNIAEFRTTYDAENAGHIAPGKIIFAEAIV